MTLSTQWLPELPIGWKVVNPKALFSERVERSKVSDTHLTPSQKLGVLPQTEYMEITGNSVVLNLTGSDNMKHVEKDDFIIHLRSFQGGIEHSKYSGKVSNAYSVLKPNNQIDPNYFKWVLKSQGYIQELNAATDQLRDGQSINFHQFVNIGLPLPPIDAQRNIAQYLGHTISRIEELSNHLLELGNKLKELKKSFLNSLFPFQGLEDFKQIQEISLLQNWKIRPLSRLGSRVSVKGFPDLEPLSVYLNLGVVPRSSRNDNKNELGRDLSNYQRVEVGDLIFNKLRTWQGGFGVAKQIGVVSPAYYVFRFDTELVIPEFVELILKSPMYLGEIVRVTKWMPPSQFDTSWNDLKSINILFPDKELQKQILINAAKIVNFNMIESLVNDLSDRLEELKNSVVTQGIFGNFDIYREGKK